MSDPSKLSPVEAIKEQSRFLRGNLAEELAADSDHFTKETAQLLKFHGSYEQDDRDARMAARKQGQGGKFYIYMVRTKIPGGRMTWQQLLAELDLCDELGNATLRITSRQGLQLHGILKENLRAVIRRINEVQLTTLGACGDVVRNVMSCPGPYTDAVHRQMQQFAEAMSAHFAPRGGAYHELWLKDPDTGEQELVGGGEDPFEVEPIYGKVYLPRKFKIGVALPEDNCIDILTQDLGFLAIVRQGKIVGYNVLVGGGFGVTPANKQTFPALAAPMAFVPVEDALAAAEAVVKAQRDHGNREDRRLARLKYVIAAHGVEWFKARVEEHFGRPMAPPEPDAIHGFSDHIGWEPQGDGRWYYGLNVENGRLHDGAQVQWKAAVREICTALRPGIRLTAHQSLLLTDLDEAQRPQLEAILKRHGVPLSEEISTVRRWSMACVAWPTCGLSITESERALPGVIDEMEVELARLGLSREAFTVRMTGCPNGCARPYNADIGLVGKAKDRYTIYLGGRLLGTRLAFLYKDLVPREKLIPELLPVFMLFKQQRQPNETLGDFCDRIGKEALLQYAEAFAGAQGA